MLSIIQLLTKYDTVLDKLLQLPKGSSKYLSPLIQNELILVLAKEVFGDIKSELQSALFFAIILNTTQDISKKEQLTLSVRCDGDLRQNKAFHQLDAEIDCKSQKRTDISVYMFYA